MAIDAAAYHRLKEDLGPDITLVAVSKFKPVEDILALYDLGQRDFGENYVQELLLKKDLCPADIRWHFIGHLQSNKVKQILPLVHLIHGVDSEKLLREVNKSALKTGVKASILLQVHIAQEETKFGWDATELESFLYSVEPQREWPGVELKGLMGMASFSQDQALVRNEFASLRALRDRLNSRGLNLKELSMGMSGDYQVAVAEGTTMVRVGSLLFGSRNG